MAPTVPGPLPEGPYTTAHFLDGMLTLTLYENGWESTQDQPFEFDVSLQGETDRHRLVFWADPFPAAFDANGDVHRISGVPNTAAGIFRWFRANPNLDVSQVFDTPIGEIPANFIDIAIAPDATNEDPGCRKDLGVCIPLFSWPNVSHMFGIGGTEVLRLYLADVRYGGKRHILAAAIESDTPDDSFLGDAERLLASAQAPVTPA